MADQATRPSTSAPVGSPSDSAPANVDLRAARNDNGYQSNSATTAARASDGPEQTPFSPGRELAPTPVTTKDRNGNVRAFAIAYVATVALGAVFILLLAQLLG